MADLKATFKKLLRQAKHLGGKDDDLGDLDDEFGKEPDFGDEPEGLGEESKEPKDEFGMDEDVGKVGEEHPDELEGEKLEEEHEKSTHEEEELHEPEEEHKEEHTEEVHEPEVTAQPTIATSPVLSDGIERLSAEIGTIRSKLDLLENHLQNMESREELAHSESQQFLQQLSFITQKLDTLEQEHAQLEQLIRSSAPKV